MTTSSMFLTTFRVVDPDSLTHTLAWKPGTAPSTRVPGLPATVIGGCSVIPGI